MAVYEDRKPEKRKRQMSPEQREKLSRLAKERHARGEFGGAKFGKLGGRPKKDRAAKRVAEAAQEEAVARQIINVFREALMPDQPMHIRLKAAEALFSVEREEAKLTMAEESHETRQRSREELLEILSGNLTEGPVAAILRRQIEPETGIIDADVVEDEHPEAA